MRILMACACLMMTGCASSRLATTSATPPSNTEAECPDPVKPKSGEDVDKYIEYLQGLYAECSIRHSGLIEACGDMD